MRLEDVRSVYFLGIGGIGMSALARYFKFLGARVSGYDKTKTPLCEKLIHEGIVIQFDEDLNKIQDSYDLVVYTPAVPKSHIAFSYFENKSIPIKKRSEVLGLISRSKKCIAVAGTHGKTTTSTLITHLLYEGGVSISAFLGGIYENLGTNFISGKSEYVVTEADEYDRSFLQLSPYIGCITSMDPDHLDIYGTVEAMEISYNQFAAQVDQKGVTIYKEDLPIHITSALKYSFGGIQSDIQVSNVREEACSYYFNYHFKNYRFDNLKFTMPGKHNAWNASIAITVALHLGLSESQIRNSLSTFQGIYRRFQIILLEPVVYIDDYAHHPEEIAATLNAIRELYPGKKVCGIFQPHLFTRTRDFVDGFAQVLDSLDKPILLDIYPAREQPIPGITSSWLLSHLKNPAKELMSKQDLLDAIGSMEYDVYVTLGAGDIDVMVPNIKNKLSLKNFL